MYELSGESESEKDGVWKLFWATCTSRFPLFDMTGLIIPIVTFQVTVVETSNVLKYNLYNQRGNL